MKTFIASLTVVSGLALLSGVRGQAVPKQAVPTKPVVTLTPAVEQQAREILSVTCYRQLSWEERMDFEVLTLKQWALERQHQAQVEEAKQWARVLAAEAQQRARAERLQSQGKSLSLKAK